MHRYRLASTAALAAVLALAGCSQKPGPQPGAEPAPVTSTTVPTPAAESVLPAPEALTDVLYRLADPEVPGTDKLSLVEGAKPADAETIDKFATVLRDGGYLPLSLQADGIGWSDRSPGHVTADVTVETAHPDTGRFFFPMEFTPNHGDWQLSQATAKSLLAFGNARTGSTAPAPPPP
ncbi:hypothetical protein [Mycobacterium sp. UM_Kg1]|uniref:hypothetical protein n=1 Tax=Mycobacterium sp. UM_Kg1 TaxID=1545691 RepID=UPI00061A947B|nr:hypothetical protein [Mycobacterium sp. UM_Kg1]